MVLLPAVVKPLCGGAIDGSVVSHREALRFTMGAIMLASLVMMALGTFRFGVNSAAYQSFRRSADAALSKAARADLKISVQVAGFAPELLAGGGVTLVGLRPELDGAWHLTRVCHRLATALTTEFEATKGAPE